jgi:hypothetical protein
MSASRFRKLFAVVLGDFSKIKSAETKSVFIGDALKNNYNYLGT